MSVDRGRRYRSRLEAGWAVFFDFLLRGKWRTRNGEKRSRNVLVEVKPITEFDLDVACSRGATCGICLGWVVAGGGEDDSIRCVDNEAVLKCFASSEGFVIDFADESAPLWGILTGYESVYNCWSGQQQELWQAHELSEQIMEGRSRATNSVQWQKRQGGRS